MGAGRPHPSAKAAPAPLRHVFFSLRREQLDLKKLYICGCWILCVSLSRSCACDERLGSVLQRTVVLQVCFQKDVTDGPSLMRPRARWDWPSSRMLGPAWCFFCQWTRTQRSSAPWVGDKLLETQLTMVLVCRRQLSSCGISVCPFAFIWNKKRSCLAAWLSAVSIFLHSFIPSNVGSG